MEDEVNSEQLSAQRNKSGPSTKKVLLLYVALPMMLCCIFGAIYQIFGRPDVLNAPGRSVSGKCYQQLGLGIHNYMDTNGFGIGNTKSKDGKPLLSWRVHILPYIEQDGLYRRFKINEPWDSPNNKPLLKFMPKQFMRLGATEEELRAAGWKTHVRGLSGQGTYFEKDHLVDDKGSIVNVDEIFSWEPDKRPMNTTGKILLFDAAEPIEWTKPGEVMYIPDELPGVGGSYPNHDRFLVLYLDGFVKFESKKMDPAIFSSGALLKGPSQLPTK